jgi:hypothetical protein
MEKAAQVFSPERLWFDGDGGSDRRDNGIMPSNERVAIGLHGNQSEKCEKPIPVAVTMVRMKYIYSIATEREGADYIMEADGPLPVGCMLMLKEGGPNADVVRVFHEHSTKQVFLIIQWEGGSRNQFDSEEDEVAWLLGIGFLPASSVTSR